MYTNGILADQFYEALDYECELENYIYYYLSKTYGNPFGNKSIRHDEMFEIFSKEDTSIKKGKSRIKLYEQMRTKGYSPEELADMLNIGVLESIVTAELHLDAKEQRRMEKNRQLEVIDTKDIHNDYDQEDHIEKVYSASSFFRLWDND